MKPSKYYSLEKEGKSAEVMIYGDVTSWPWLESDVSSYNLSKQLQELDVDEITVGINSYGGEVGEGLAIYNALKNHRAKVTTRVDGFACSIASVIFAAGDRRIMNESSLIMVHNAWTTATGNAAELRKAADDADKINDASVKAYTSACDIDEETIRVLMDDETWISPDEAIDLGLATDILRDKTDKPSQNARKKVYMLLTNPYQLENEEEEPGKKENPDPELEIDETEGEEDETEPEKDEDGEVSQKEDENAENEGENDEIADENAENAEETDENADDSDENKDNEDVVKSLLKAIMKM